MLPDFLQARAAIKKKQHTFLITTIRRHTPDYLRQAHTRTFYEGDRMAIHYGDGQVYEKPTSLLSAKSGSGSISELKINPNKVYEHLENMAKNFVEKHIAAMTDTLKEVSELTGNVVESRGFTAESILAILEKLSIEFDEKGTANLQTIMVHPDNMQEVTKILTDIQTDPVLKLKYDQLMDTKRKQWHDRKNSRKLAG